MPRFEGGSADTGGGAAIAAQLVQNEVPLGLINGVNTLFTTTNPFLPNTLQVYMNGDLQEAGGNDYTEGVGTFTFVLPLKVLDKVLVTYIKP